MPGWVMMQRHRLAPGYKHGARDGNFMDLGVKQCQIVVEEDSAKY